MARLRSINTSMWNDPWIMELNPIEKLLWIYLLTNDSTNMLGAYQLTVKRASFDTGIEMQEITSILSKFEKDKRIVYQSHFLVIINWAKNQSYNKNMLKSAFDCYQQLKPELQSLIPQETKEQLEL